ncbi:MAG: NAD(P)/FAD-dependent oxidoreductase [Candidatus Thermoplasmatota archaeon]|nr:NAD(P)/FAD-dependent oxidoreductase [Candidatus Thermoplasmatota archaeon]
MYDALVIGAGPAGTNVSYQLSKRGFKVRMVDIKKKVGIPNHCSGLVDKRVVDLVGEDLVTDRPSSAEISTPFGSFNLRSDRMRVIDRVALDQKLAMMAQSEGTEMSLTTMLTGLRQGDEGIVATLKSKEGFETVESKFLIGADGPTSSVRRSLGIKAPRLLASLQYDLRRSSDRVKINLNRKITPDFFSWEIPNGSEVEVGASGRNSEEVVKAMTGNDTIKRRRGGLIPIGSTELGNGRCFLIGDAAGLSKATTGGGLFAALDSGNVLANAMERGKDVLRDYQRSWKNSFGSEIKRDYKIRKLLDKYEKYYGLWVPLVSSSISGINRVGDVDYPSKTLLYMLYSIPMRFPLAVAEFISNLVP